MVKISYQRLLFPKGTAGWRMMRVIRPEAGEDHQVFDRTH
jgi:hypothetical protein